MDGFINVNKAQGLSSGYVVAALKRLFHSKTGHCGTLDPNACGVLPVCLGKATRLSEYVVGQEKRYIGEVTFGVHTDSYDAQGALLHEQDASFVTQAMVERLLPEFVGEILQAPPPVSALKRGGEPLYRKVRRGEAVTVEPRAIFIHSLELLDFTADGAHPRCRLAVHCGKGAYIRSIAFDLGERLGCGAHLSALQRTEVGRFRIEDSFTLEEIYALAAEGKEDFLLSMDSVLSHLPEIHVSGPAVRKLAHGNAAPWPAPDAPLLRIKNETGLLLGVGASKDQLVSMHKVLVEAADFAKEPLTVCAIGNFDGLHLGHRALFLELAQQRRAYGGRSAVLTFSPHPLALIRGQSPALLTSEALKNTLIKQYFAVDEIITVPFDKTLMESSSQQFLENIIAPLQVQSLVVGYNFTYAAGGEATADVLRAEGAAAGYQVCIVPEVRGPYGVVSSSKIRSTLAAGDLAATNAMLGYWFCVEGEVIEGNRIGRTIGFPTANLLFAAEQAAPPHGVYTGRVEYAGATYGAVLNYGVKPTIAGERKPLLEAHLFDTDLPLYGEKIRVFFGSFLRGEQRFTDLSALKAQITADSEAARAFLLAAPEKAHLPQKID